MYAACCNILGVKPGSDITEIKRAYHRKAKLFHPDLNHAPNAGLEFIKIKKAFDYLSRFQSSFVPYSFVYSRQSYRKDPYYHATSFDWDKYRRMQNQAYQYTAKHKNNFDFKSTIFGKIIFYFFHVLFLFAGLYISVGPVISVLSYGIEPEKSIIATIFIVCIASLFGITMVVMVILSGLSINIYKKI